MRDFFLSGKLTQLKKSGCTLLWLEGARHERVLSFRLTGSSTLVLNLANGTTRFLSFERYSSTEVGLQFWSRGRPGVLFRWEKVPQSVWSEIQPETSDEGPTPPDMAA